MLQFTGLLSPSLSPVNQITPALENLPSFLVHVSSLRGNHARIVLLSPDISGDTLG